MSFFKSRTFIVHDFCPPTLFSYTYISSIFFVGHFTFISIEDNFWKNLLQKVILQANPIQHGFVGGFPFCTIQISQQYGFNWRLFCYRVYEGKVVFFNWALREKNIQVRLYLMVVLKSWDVDILIIRTNFQKSNIGWPQQPPTEMVQKLKKYISWFH